MYIGGVLDETDDDAPVWKPRARAAPPAHLDMRPFMTEIRDQSSSSMCVAYALACVKEFQERAVARDVFSPQYIYYNRANSPSAGMSLSDGMRVLARKGCPLEASYPVDYNGAPSRDVDSQAANFRISAYARVNTQAELKTALSEIGPCIVSFTMYNNSMHFWRQQAGDRDRGGHAVAIVGYNDEDRWFILRNSWGGDWGDRGYCYYPYSEWGKHRDIYAAIDGPSSHDYPFVRTKRGCCVVL